MSGAIVTLFLVCCPTDDTVEVTVVVALATRANDVVDPKLVTLAKEVRSAGGKALFVRTDVTRAADVEALVARAVSEFGALHWASNNAAGGAHSLAR